MEKISFQLLQLNIKFKFKITFFKSLNKCTIYCNTKPCSRTKLCRVKLQSREVLCITNLVVEIVSRGSKTTFFFSNNQITLRSLKLHFFNEPKRLHYFRQLVKQLTLFGWDLLEEYSCHKVHTLRTFLSSVGSLKNNWPTLS